MTPAHCRYVATESILGGVISAALSLTFVLLMFGRLSSVPVAGSDGMIMDAMPQGFAIALMSTLVPTLLTRRRLARGMIAPLVMDMPYQPLHPLVRALLIAAMGAALTTALTALLLVGNVKDVALPIVAIGKTIWGLVLGSIIAAMVTRAALTQNQVISDRTS